MMNDSLREIEGKSVHDPYRNIDFGSSKRCVLVQSPVIIGAGPSGLAAAACLKAKGVPSLVLERSNCIASLWQLKTYDRLKLHLPKQFCELPFMPFPKDFPDYPTKQQFIQYLEAYASRFQINPIFNQRVVRAEFDGNLGFWRVTTTALADPDHEYQDQVEYLSRWLVVATGENAEEAVPAIEGMEDFGGAVTHTSGYKSGEAYKGRKVLVVGCGNSGMEVCLDLCNYNARPSLVVRDAVRIFTLQFFCNQTRR